MNLRLVTLGAAAIAVALSACGKKDTAAGTDPSPAAATTNVSVNGGTVATREEEGVTRYGDEGPESGTVITRRQITIHKSADKGSDVLGRLGPGTGVNKKARHGAYFLVDWPTAQGMKPGWVSQDEVAGTAVVPTVTVPPPVAAPPTVTATAPPTPPVGGAPGSRPGPIRITH